VSPGGAPVGELLNGVIAATGAQVYDPGGVETGTYAVKKRTYGYGQQRRAGYVFNSGDPAAIVNHGAFIALSDLSERLIGGDVYIKRALNATLQHAGGNRDATQGYSAAGAFEANTLFGNIATAQDASYLQNAAVINALIGAEPQSAFTAENDNFARQQLAA
jgi:hypothetical protein